MTNEIIEMTFKKMGIQPYEEFRLKRHDAEACFNKTVYFTEGLNLFYANSRTAVSGFEIIDILSGFFEIVKIKEPTKEDKIIIGYARLFGYNWIAVDGDGEIVVSKSKLQRCDLTDCWETTTNESEEYLLGKLSFLTWEDEPYYIGGEE